MLPSQDVTDDEQVVVTNGLLDLPAQEERIRASGDSERRVAPQSEQSSPLGERRRVEAPSFDTHGLLP